MTDEQFNEELAKAERFVAGCDKRDGFEDRDPLMICIALEGGLRRWGDDNGDESNSAFDALVMMRDWVKRNRRGGFFEKQSN